MGFRDTDIDKLLIVARIADSADAAARRPSGRDAPAAAHIPRPALGSITENAAAARRPGGGSVPRGWRISGWRATRPIVRRCGVCPYRDAAAAALAGLIIGVGATMGVGAGVAHANPIYVAATDETDCVGEDANINSFLSEHGANVMRVVLNPGDVGDGLNCIQEAVEGRYKVYLSLQYPNAWNPQQTAAWFGQVLPTYAPYLWAVAVGNEPDDQRHQGALGGRGTVCTNVVEVRIRVARVRVRTHRRHRRHRRWKRRDVRITRYVRSCRATTYGEDYAAVWSAVEPVLASVVPDAIRVYGDASPWGFQFLEEGWDTSTPVGVQAIAFHCYDTTIPGTGLTEVPQVAAWAASVHEPLWCSEMAPALLPPGVTWLQTDTQASWASKLAAVEQASPDLQMITYYEWPSL